MTEGTLPAPGRPLSSSRRPWLSPRTLGMAALGLVVSALALVLAFWHVRLAGGLALEPRFHLAELGRALRGVRPGWLAVFVVANLATLGARAVQLAATARRRDGHAPGLHACYQAVAVAQMAQNVLPARLSEAVRVVALTRADDVGPGAATGAVLLGRVLDLGALLVVTCLPVLALRLPAASSRGLRLAAAVGTAAALVVVALLLLFYRRRQALARQAASVRPWLGRAVAGIAEGLSALGDARRLVVAAAASLAIPLLLAACYGSALYAFGLGSLPAGTTLVLVLAVLCAIAIPSAPSSVGVFHAAVTLTLTSLGAPAAAAAAFALCTHAISVVSFVAAGSIALAHLGGRSLLRQA